MWGPLRRQRLRLRHRGRLAWLSSLWRALELARGADLFRQHRPRAANLSAVSALPESRLWLIMAARGATVTALEAARFQLPRPRLPSKVGTRLGSFPA